MRSTTNAGYYYMIFPTVALGRTQAPFCTLSPIPAQLPSLRSRYRPRLLSLPLYLHHIHSYMYVLNAYLVGLSVRLWSNQRNVGFPMLYNELSLTICTMKRQLMMHIHQINMYKHLCIVYVYVNIYYLLLKINYK